MSEYVCGSGKGRCGIRGGVRRKGKESVSVRTMSVG